MTAISKNNQNTFMENCLAKKIIYCENGTLALNYKELDDLLNAKSNALNIIVIFGKERFGKSYFMNILKILLEGEKNNQFNAFICKKGIRRVTEGFWAIVANTSPVINSSILLCDTEGAFGMGNEDIISFRLLAFSATISSCLIVNMDKKINKNELKFMYSALKCATLNRSNKFNDLVFLVRDWSETHEFDFGLIGGQKYLKSLDVEILKEIMCMFKNTKCFLLPYIGNEQERNEQYCFDYKVPNKKKKCNTGEFVTNEFDQYCQQFIDEVVKEVKTSYDPKSIKINFKTVVENINEIEEMDANIILINELQEKNEKLQRESEEKFMLHRQIYKELLINLNKKYDVTLDESEENRIDETINKKFANLKELINKIENYLKESTSLQNKSLEDQKKFFKVLNEDIKKFTHENKELREIAQSNYEKEKNSKSPSFIRKIINFLFNLAHDAMDLTFKTINSFVMDELDMALRHTSDTILEYCKSFLYP